MSQIAFCQFDGWNIAVYDDVDDDPHVSEGADIALQMYSMPEDIYWDKTMGWQRCTSAAEILPFDSSTNETARLVHLWATHYRHSIELLEFLEKSSARGLQHMVS